MRILVDSNVLSEPTRPSPSPRVIDWLRLNQPHLVVTPIILGELEFGILQLPASQKRQRLEKWFTEGVQRLQVIDFDTESAAHWARLLARLKKNGWAMPIKDSLIAASALAKDLTLATRNTEDFRHSGVRLVNPFQS